VLLLGCFDHCLRNALEPGQKNGGRQTIVSASRPTCVGAFRQYMEFSAQKLPIVLFDIFWTYMLEQLATETVTYPDGRVREPQPGWAQYLRKNKLEETGVQLANGEVMKLLNAAWRGGPDLPTGRVSTSPQESFHGVAKEALHKHLQGLLREDPSTAQHPNFPELVCRMDKSMMHLCARQDKYRDAALRAFPNNVDENLRDSCKAFQDKRATDVAARQYWASWEAGKRNRVVVQHQSSKFYVFASSPDGEVDEVKANSFVKLLCLPPDSDRHRAFLESEGYVVHNRLSWRRFKEPFDSMEVVEYLPQQEQWSDKVRCFNCYTRYVHYQCGHYEAPAVNILRQ